MLSTAEAKAAAPRSRAWKLFDGQGLFLFVAPTGCKSWRMKYRHGGREKLLTFGRFPEVSVNAARARRDAARAQLRAGQDPAQAVTQIESFEELARAWHDHMCRTWSATHGADVLAGLERDVFPALGHRAAASITAPELLGVLRGIEARDRIETARRLRQRLSMIFRYGTAEGFLEDDPAEKLGAAMRSSRPPRPHPALTAIEDCRALLAACDHVAGAGNMVAHASRFLALTAVRLDAVRGMRWNEVEDLDGPQPLWRVPPARMKLKREKKDEARFEHLVPLAPAAVAVLHAASHLLHPNRANLHSGGADLHAGLVFPGRSPTSPLGERAIGTLYVRAGFAGRHVPHGWRASFSTILNEQLGDEWAPAIDRALAHSPKDKVEAAYNRALQLTRRRQLFDRWAELLCG